MSVAHWQKESGRGRCACIHLYMFSISYPVISMVQGGSWARKTLCLNDPDKLSSGTVPVPDRQCWSGQNIVLT